MKKLIPALCMLLVAAALLGTSTFAWFSINTTVHATGMSVKAAASKNLLISKSEASGFSAAIDFTEDGEVTSLVPVSTSGTTGANPTFYKVDDVGEGMTADSHEKADDTTFKAAVSGTDYVQKTMYVKATSGEFENLSATVSCTGTAADLDPALRVMLVVNEDRFFFAPNAGATSPWKGISDTDGAEGAEITAGTATQTILDELTGTCEVTVYIWYEGQDESCYSLNAEVLQTKNIQITFTATPVEEQA